jgi:hypothetical protein
MVCGSKLCKPSSFFFYLSPAIDHHQCGRFKYLIEFLINFLQVFNCPNITELSLDFIREGNDSTDLPALMVNLGRTCPELRNLHVASTRLSNDAVLALASADLRY